MIDISRKKSRKKTRDGHLKVLTPEELADCEAFGRWNDWHNDALEAAGEKRFSFGDWEKLTGTDRNTVAAMARGERAIPERIQLDAAAKWNQQPQIIFPSWRWPQLTRIAPDARIAAVAELLSGMKESERREALWLFDVFNRSNKALRLKIMRELRKRTAARIGRSSAKSGRTSL